ncbi:MAG: carboxypeptidase regulatory-like domain-containing protein [Thermoplasmata archaeon]|nr:MAG: carboxypeptidase regulatory-like domain-containing protein [Thermoplasmata archaeon]
MEPINCTLKGYIKNPDGPLGSAYIQVYRLGETRPTQYWPEVNWTDGYFELNLSRGVWQVEVQDMIHYTQTLSVLMVNGKTTWQNFTLVKLPTESATIQGYVRYYHNGSGVPWANINARNQNMTWNRYNSSDNTGWYTMTVLTGEITLDAWSDPYGSKPTTITAQDGGNYFLDITVIDWWSYGYLEGYVRVGGFGETDVGITVSYGNWRYDDRTDSFGYYNISVPGGPMEIQAYKDGFKHVMTQVNTSAFNTTVQDIDLEPLDWACELRGYINNTNGEPVEGAYASFDYDGYGWQSATGVTDYTGLFQRMAPSGDSSYFIFAEDHEYKTGNVDLPSDQIFWFNETLEHVKNNAKIVATFTNIYTGKPIKHAEITFSEQDLRWFSSSETNGNGVVRADVPSGFVGIGIDAWENGYMDPGMFRDPSTMQFLLRPSETKWLNIGLFPREKRSLFYGYVNDTSINPIQDATVYVQYGDTIITNTTDSSGYYEIRIPGDQWIQSWVRAPRYKIAKYSTWIWDWDYRNYNWILEDSPAWIEGPITDSAVDLDGDLQYDVLYVNVTVYVDQLGDYWLDGDIAESSNSNQRISGTGADFGDTLGSQVVTLTFMGEQIRNSGMNGYYVNLEIYDNLTWELLDEADYYTKPYSYDEFEKPNARIEKPVDFWLVDSDLDGLFNYLVLNVTLNISEAGDYTLLAPIRDIWGNEFEMGFETFSLEIGLNEVQISIDGTSIYNNGETIGSCYLVLFEGFPMGGSDFIHTLFFYTPFEHDIFQFYNIDSFISGYVTDMGNLPIEGITVWAYNITQRYLNETQTDASGYYELGGWSGDWILVINDYEDDDNIYQGDLTEVTLSTGMTSHDFLNLPYTMLDETEMQLIFSDWNNTYLDWLLYVMGDNKTIRFEMDVLQFGNGDGFVSEEEVEIVMGMLSQLSLPDYSDDSFLVDGIYYDLNPSSLTRDAGLAGPITSTDPIYIHMTGEYMANSTIPDPSPHDLTLNCTYDDTDSGSFIGNNVTHIIYVVPPSGWGRTGNGIPLNVSITGSDYITADPLGDPNPGDSDIGEWVNITISLGVTPSTGTIKGNVTLHGGSGHSGVEVTVYDNVTSQEVGKGHTNPDGNYEIAGLPPGDYNVVAHKAGYVDNWSYNMSLSTGMTLWLDFTLYSYPPTIIHTPVTGNLMGDAIEILADVTDDGQVDEVILYYKDVNSDTYSSTTLTKIPSTSTFMGAIPAQIEVGYVYYYIWANDTKGNFVTHPEIGNHSVYIYELNPPDITNGSAVPNIAEYPEFVNVSAEIKDDETNVEIVKIFVEYPDMSTTNLTMDYAPLTGRYYRNVSYSMLGTYNYTIWANDSLDNWNSFSGSFQVLDTTPPLSNVEMIVPYWYTSSPILINALASDSGIGIMNVELWYRFSNDNSSWGMWTSYGSDPTTPYQWSFNFPSGDGYYEFFSIAYDGGGNPETMKASAEAICGYDTIPPTSNINLIDTYWRTSPLISIEATSSDTTSGLMGVELWYRYSVDNSSWGSWISFGTDNTAPYQWPFNFSSGEGFYEFFSIAEDIAGNSETMKVAAETLCGYDYTEPTSNVVLIDPYWYKTSPITIDATSSDVTSGVENVELWYRYSIDNSTWGLWTLYGSDTSPLYQWSFDFPNGEGYYEFYSLADDNAQNSETVKILAESLCGYDFTAPTSNVNIIIPYWVTNLPITISATASDNLIGIESVELLYRFSVDNSTWDPWTLFWSDTTAPYSWDFNLPDGEGFYEFYSMALDLLSNEETAPSSADAICAYDLSPTLITSFSSIPDPCELGQAINISATITDISGIGGVWVELNVGGTLVGNYTMSNDGQVYWYLYTPDGLGTVDVVIWTVDNNDNWISASDSVSVQDTTKPAILDFDISPTNPQVGGTIRVSVNVSDVLGILLCKIDITDPEGNWLLNESMTNEPGTDIFYYETDYDILGDYQIVIWAEDANGVETTYLDTITVTDSSPPTADAGPNQQVTVGTQVTLDGGLSSDNHGIANYTWSFNENGLKRVYGEVAYYTFNTVDDYEITLTVRDFEGNIDTIKTWVNVSAVSGIGIVTGTVLDEDGNPVQGATVYVEGDPSVENTTDSLGRYVLEDVPTGNQRIIIVKDGYQRNYEDVNVQQGQTTTTDDIVLGKSVSEEETPLGLFAALAAVIAIIVILVFFLLTKGMKKSEADKTLIDEVFFMYNDGRLIKHFTRRLKPDMDEDILSSMLVAVQDFIKDSFRDTEGILDEIKFGRFQVLLGRGKHIILATIVLGDEVEPFRPQVQKCVADIEEKYGDVLEDWDGELSKVAGASKYVMDLIDGEYA